MEREERTVTVDTIKHQNTEWENVLFINGSDAFDRPVYGKELDINGSVSITFDEYSTTIEGLMEVTISWVNREYEGEPYEEDHRIESVEVLK